MTSTTVVPAAERARAKFLVHPNTPIRFRYLHPGLWECLSCGDRVGDRSVHVWGTRIDRIFDEGNLHGWP